MIVKQFIERQYFHQKYHLVSWSWFAQSRFSLFVINTGRIGEPRQNQIILWILLPSNKHLDEPQPRVQTNFCKRVLELALKQQGQSKDKQGHLQKCIFLSKQVLFECTGVNLFDMLQYKNHDRLRISTERVLKKSR